MTVEGGHHEVEHDDGVISSFEQLDGFAAVLRDIDGITAAPEELLQQKTGAGVVIDDEGGFYGVHDEWDGYNQTGDSFP